MRFSSTLVLASLLALPFVSACDDGEDDTTSDGDTSSGSDSNTESGGDGDGDGDTGGDGDSAGDGDGDTGGDGDGDGDGDGGGTGADTGGSGHAGSCDFQPDGLECWHAVNEFDEPAQIEMACTMANGTYSTGDCTTDNLVAICDQTPFKIFHYYDGIDLTLAEVTCSNIGGVWMPQ